MVPEEQARARISNWVQPFVIESSTETEQAIPVQARCSLLASGSSAAMDGALQRISTLAGHFNVGSEHELLRDTAGKHAFTECAHTLLPAA